ncbi:heavy metal-associated domain-containing protein [Sulfuricurvum sp.]|uniref:heavy-metal-associated domain-containing protein n=1 Tax=Sulfuricurvum sp. TaxID=2025608 RepID=UPI0025E9EEA0|nr:heavy metal-associated domain-containing protein [Sulfuricurvum sp.]
MKKILLSLMALVAIASADQLVKLNVSGMTCPACVKNVKGSLNEVSGVKESAVYLKEGKAEVKASDGTKADSLCDAVKKAGYGCSVAK